MDVKMSKSNVQDTIFLHDDRVTIAKKISGAFCEAGNIEVNPVLIC